MRATTAKLLALAAVASLTVSVAGGCVRSKHKGDTEGMTSEQKEGFDLAARRCSKCHDFEELYKYHKKDTSLNEWRSLVDDMADESGSGITRTERPKITEALFAWSQKSGK